MQKIRNGRDNLIGRKSGGCGWNRDVVCRLQLKDIGISSSTFSKVESGRSNPSAEMLRVLAEMLQCSYEKFYVWDSPEV